MPKDSVRKRCVECRATYGGTRGKAEWCPDCGGEMVAIFYRQRRKANRGRR